MSAYRHRQFCGAPRAPKSVVCATDDFTSDGATLPAEIATARFVRYTIADKSDPKCICPRPQNHPAVLQPDMLDSLDRFDMAARTTRPVWITVNVPADAPAGIYRSQITVTRGDGCGKIRLPFELEVQDHLLLPPTGGATTSTCGSTLRP